VSDAIAAGYDTSTETIVQATRAKQPRLIGTKFAVSTICSIIRPSMEPEDPPKPSYLHSESPPGVPKLPSLVGGSGLLSSPPPTPPISKTRIFIVHGHNDAPMFELSHHLRGELETIILREELNRGRTIPEKLSDFATQAGYAVVLFTGDDEGRKKGAASLQSRARQNVVYEMDRWRDKNKGRRVSCGFLTNGATITDSNMNRAGRRIEAQRCTQRTITRSSAIAGLPMFDFRRPATIDLLDLRHGLAY